ncbi:MAG: AAA family ATPase, partial [Nanoarchaeota archaeon]
MAKNDLVKLEVVESLQDDVYKGIARIDPELMKGLGLARGDIISIKGGRETFAIVDRAYPADVGENIIRIDGLIRKNSRVSLGEHVQVRKANLKKASRVIIAPSQSGIMVQGDPEMLRNGLLGRPVLKGDILSLGSAHRRRDVMGEGFPDIFGDLQDLFSGHPAFSGFQQIKFIVASISPNQGCFIGEDTEVILNPKAVEVADETVPDVAYEDVGGMREEIKKVREMVELPLKHPEIFEKLGIDPPKGVLLHGPPGTGKTLLARAVANETDSNFILLNGPEIMSKFYGESEKKIRDIFEDAQKNAPSIIFFDEIDAIAPKREEVQGEVERRVVSQLLSMMDGLKSRGKVVVIGPTNRINSIDPALRRPGRFDREIEILVPNKLGRLEILKIHTRNMPLAKNVNLDFLAGKTHGFVGADLSALTKEAAMSVLRKMLPELKLEEDAPIPKEVLDKIIIRLEDFEDSLKVVRPSAMREVFVEAPNISWTDIGGMEKTKQELKEAVEWPILHPEAFKRMGIRAPRGILLYGPPGTGKTLLAKA